MSKRYMPESKKKSNFGKILLFLIVVAALVGVIYYLINNNHFKKITEGTISNENNEPVVQKTIPEDSVANIVAIGDTLCHSQNFKDAYDSSTGIYDFSPMFKYVEKYFKNKTVAVGNCEATFASASRGYSGYPTFNTPEHLAIDLKELGLDIMTTANNHTLDMGFSGLTSTLGFLDDAGLKHTGSARTYEEQDKLLFQDLNGIKTCFLAFTYGTNGIPVPTGKEYCVNLIDKDFIKAQIDKAKSQGAELIVVSMHWGDEYHTEPNAVQKDLADFLVKNGVQVILGCHPHVLEPMTMVTAKDDEGVEHTGFCIYSMGNFFSAQTFANTRNTVILNVQVRKDGESGKISIDNATYTPVYVYDNGTSVADRYELLDIETIISEYESGVGSWSKSLYELAKTELNRTVGIVGEEIFNNPKTKPTVEATSTESNEVTE